MTLAPRLETQAALDQALAALTEADKRLAPVLAASGKPALRRRPGGFAGLATILMGQQLSTASAAAIWGRLSGAYTALTPAAILATEDAALGALGLSRAKIRALKAIAAALEEGRLDLDGLATMEADAAHAALTTLHGVGPWTADVYLLFCLGHADAWPAGDLAVQEAVRAGLGLPARPSAKAMATLAEPWRPHRGAAAHLWWAYYRVLRRRDGVLAP